MISHVTGSRPALAIPRPESSDLCKIGPTFKKYLEDERDQRVLKILVDSDNISGLVVNLQLLAKYLGLRV